MSLNFFKPKPTPLYEIDNSQQPPSCLPAHLDKSNLIDITTLADPWRKYMDAVTGKIHDGAEYYKLLHKDA